MRKRADIQAEVESLERLYDGLAEESHAIDQYAVIWMNARAALGTEKEKKLFDIWMQTYRNGAYLDALKWALNDKNPRMVGENEPRDYISADVMHKIEFYHGMHTHVVCKLKGNLFCYHRDGNKEMYDKTITELRKYIPGI